MAETLDVAIVGGGPAGQAAALELVGHRCPVCVIDEQGQPGGQILRQANRGLPPGDRRDYPELRAQLRRFEAQGIDWRGGRSVLGIAPRAERFDVLLSGPDGAELLSAKRVLVAAGCQDLAVPLPGWTLPGVMTAGGIQALLKGQNVVAGQRLLFAGTHPLMLLIADQLQSAGAEVAGVLFAQPVPSILKRLAANATVILAGGVNLGMALAALVRLRKARVPVRSNARVLAIHGGTGVEGVELESGERIACDTVGLCFGFAPQADLVRAAGVSMRSAGAAGGWAAIVDRWMMTDVPGLYAAGETTGVAGGPAAATEGALAGIAMARDLGLLSDAEAERRATSLRSRHRRQLAFAQLLESLADPSPWWPALLPDTLVCRCENVAAGDLERALDSGCSANAAKLLTRCGMGVCQGRNCEPTLLRMLAARGRKDDSGFAARFPARPVRIGDLAP
jgi:thioredoxin reductase